MFTPEHMDYLNEVVEKVNQLADEDPDARVADLIDDAFCLVELSDYMVQAYIDDRAPADEERESYCTTVLCETPEKACQIAQVQCAYDNVPDGEFPEPWGA